MDAKKNEQKVIANADRKSVNLDELTVKINRLNRYIMQADKRMGAYQAEANKALKQLKHQRDYAAQQLDRSASVRGEA